MATQILKFVPSTHKSLTCGLFFLRILSSTFESKQKCFNIGVLSCFAILIPYFLYPSYALLLIHTQWFSTSRRFNAASFSGPSGRFERRWNSSTHSFMGISGRSNVHSMSWKALLSNFFTKFLSQSAGKAHKSFLTRYFRFFRKPY